MRYLVCSALLLFGFSAAQASVFDFSYSGVAKPLLGGSATDISASGTLDVTAMGGGVYKITDITGIRDVDNSSGVFQYQQTITDTGANFGYLFTDSSGNFQLQTGGAGILVFGVSGSTSGTDTVEYLSGVGYQETFVPSNLVGTTTATLTNFKITDPPAPSVPEPSTVLLFSTLGPGVWFLARKMALRQSR
jgi:hypothetical protein